MPDSVSSPGLLESRLRSGETDALAEVWALHRDRLLRLVTYRMDPRLPRRLDPEDVLQEAYLAAQQRLAHFALGGFTSAFVWLRLIVLQSLVDVHRHHLGAQARDAGREVAGDGGGSQASAAFIHQLSGGHASPSAPLLANERRELLARAVTSLSESDQEILALRHGEQLGNQEIAATLGIEEKAASIRYVRALRRLKEALSAGGGLTTELGHAR